MTSRPEKDARSKKPSAGKEATGGFSTAGPAKHFDQKEKCMESKAKLLARLAAAAVLLTGLLIAVPGSARPASGPSPLLLGGDLNENSAGIIVGGFDAKTTVGFFPVRVGGRVLESAEGGCPDVGENATARTDLLPPGTRLTFYALEDGTVVGTGTSGDIGFQCLDASGQILLEPKLTDVKENSKKDTDLVLGMREDMKFAAVPTERTEGKGGALTFTAKTKDASVSLKKIKEDGDDMFAGILRRDGKEHELFRIVADDEDIAGSFLDLGADGNLEFLLIHDGPAGSLAVYGTSLEKKDNTLFLIDTGE